MNIAVKWTVYIILTICGVTVLAPIIVDIWTSIFVPDHDIAINKYVQLSSILLSILSVVLAIYSVWQAKDGDKQSQAMIEQIKSVDRHIHDLQEENRRLNLILFKNSLPHGIGITTDEVQGNWEDKKKSGEIENG